MVYLGNPGSLVRRLRFCVFVAVIIGFSISTTSVIAQRDFSGTYEGQWLSGDSALRGDATVVLVQTGTELTGTITMSGTRTFGRTPTPLKGTAEGDSISFAAAGVGCTLRVDNLRSAGVDQSGREAFKAFYFCTRGNNTLTLYKVK